MKNKFHFFPLTLTLVLLLFSACSGSKYDKADPSMPQEMVDQYEKSIEENKAIVKEDSENMEALFQLAFDNDQLGKHKEAIKYYEKVLASDPTHFATLNNMAIIYEEAEEYDKAADYIKKLYENYEDNGQVINATVRILLKAGEPNNAENALKNYASLHREEEGINPFISDLYDQIHNYRQNETSN